MKEEARDALIGLGAGFLLFKVGAADPSRWVRLALGSDLTLLPAVALLIFCLRGSISGGLLLGAGAFLCMADPLTVVLRLGSGNVLALLAACGMAFAMRAPPTPARDKTPSSPSP